MEELVTKRAEQVDPNAGDGRQQGSKAELFIENKRNCDTETGKLSRRLKTGLQSKLNCKTGGNLNILIWPKEMCHNNILLYIVSKGKVIFSV